MAKFKYTITDEDAKLPIKQLIRSRFGFSARLRSKLKYSKLVYLNGETVAGWITPKVGDILTIDLPHERSNFVPEDIPIDVVYEDDDLLVINKQPYITVHPTRGCPNHTIANGIMKRMIEMNESYKIRFINRLDTDTSGLLIVGKNSYVQNEIIKQMKANSISKYYQAVVSGDIDANLGDTFTIDKPIGRPSQDQIARSVLPIDQGGYPSVTHVSIIRRYGSFTLVRLKLETGRTHQIRVHMSSIGHSLVGDRLYGDTNTHLLSRQALHAYKLELTHPITKQRLILESSLPSDIEELLAAISK